MIFKVLFLVVVAVYFAEAQYAKQKDVKPNIDCNCDKFLAVAKKCGWSNITTCDEENPTKVYLRFKNRCDVVNNYREKRRAGETKRTFTRGVSCFARMSRAKRDAIFASAKMDPNRITPKYLFGAANSKILTSTALKTSDWTAEMVPVKNQGQCGSCWAFATVAIFERAQNKLNNNIGALMKAYSEQYLLSCDTRSFKCNGGYTSYAMDTLQNTGTVLDSTVPYTATSAACPATTSTAPVKSTVGYWEQYRFAGGNCTRLRQLLTNGPVVISMFVEGDSFYQYRGGAYSGKTCYNNGTTNHAMVAVGYGTIPGTALSGFKVRNSWGATTWGDKGHVWFAENGNPCGLCTNFVYLL